MKQRWWAVAALLLLLVGAPRAGAQDDDSAEGIGPAPSEARAVIERAIEAMGGRAALDAVGNAALTVQAPAEQVQEQHTLRVDGRFMHYASRRPSGAGFDVVIARELAFLCDRDPKGVATYVVDLSPDDLVEGSYERDILFMPLLLPALLERGARMDYRGRNSEGHEVVRALVPPAVGGPGRPFVIRLLFDKDTSLLASAMGIVPLGHDKGKKRYCDYRDYAPVGPLKLPHTIHDARGKDDQARTFPVTWRVNASLPPEKFLRPHVPEEPAETLGEPPPGSEGK